MDLRDGLLLFIILVGSLCIHEWAHAWVALKLGDETAYKHGRVTLNPIPHIDLLGTIVFPLLCIFLLNGQFFFGWAKPVPVTVTRFKHLRLGDLLTTFAGPFSNLLLAVAAALLGGLASRANPLFMELTVRAIVVNITLFVFNLLPVPPLDGGRILRVFVGMTWETFARISSWSMFALILVMNFVPAISGHVGATMAYLARPLLQLSFVIAGVF